MSSRHFPYSLGLLPFKECNLWQTDILRMYQNSWSFLLTSVSNGSLFILFLFVFLKNLTSDTTHPLSTINHLNTLFQKVSNLGIVTFSEVDICIAQKNESIHTLRRAISVSRKTDVSLHISFR